jgi:hypothetical protein
LAESAGLQQGDVLHSGVVIIMVLTNKNNAGTVYFVGAENEVAFSAHVHAVQ